MRRTNRLDRKVRPVQDPRPPVPPPAPASPLFIRMNWVAFLVTFVVTWTVYLLTLAPEVTLEDSGELVTGSFYAGIPHPPGYPVWTLYSWLWTALLPVGNIAWRVALAEATAGAVSCALIALLVSAASRLLLEGAGFTRDLSAQWVRAICVVSGCAAGLLMGFDGFMWRESVAVNRIAVSSIPWFLLMLVFLLRWLYEPQRYRYLYWALFIFGICFATHQSLIVAAMGVEVLIVARSPRLGRDVLLGNGVIYLVYQVILLTTGQHLFHNLGAKPGLLLLFNLIGAGSLLASGWLALQTRGLFTEWKPVVLLGFLWLLGASFYFYLPISCMTNPPMEWCYPRSVDGFAHALSRGQYEQPNPTNLLTEPGRFAGQLGMLAGGVADSFTWVCVLVALVPFLFLRKMPPRERAWLIGLGAIYLCVGVLLLILLNPTPERASAELVKVFFNASHTLVAALIGQGLALTAAFMGCQYLLFRRWGLLGGAVAVALALYNLLDIVGRHYFGPAGQIGPWDLPHWIGRAFEKNQYGLPVFAGLLLVVVALAFMCALAACRRRAPLLMALSLFATMPFYSVLSHWYECDQRGHLFGYWFGHDMFNPPFQSAEGERLYPEMSRNAILYGGTDPGRFCPTYMVFCESFTPHRLQPAEDRQFDRRDVYVITQNALVDPPYLDYIRAQYHRSAQADPPFFSELARRMMGDKDYQTNLLARLSLPLDRCLAGLGEKVEARRRTSTSWFTENDFKDLPAVAARLQPAPQQDPVSKYLYASLSVRTQQFLSARTEEPHLRRALADDLNRLLERDLQTNQLLSKARSEKALLEEQVVENPASARALANQAQLEIERLSQSEPFYTSERFQHVTLSDELADFVRQNPQGPTRIRLNRLLLEAAYGPAIGRSAGGVYPDREIYTPSAEEAQHSIQGYMEDLGRRAQLNQLRPGEEVIRAGDRLQVSGQGAIMSMNGAVAKLIFDRNPDHEFYVEESMPIEWMYPHLTPFGIIMKINRRPLTALPADVLDRDHQFWKQYSSRLTGDICDYQTPTRQITDWIEKTYLRRNFNGFTGDRKFIHDLDAQKSFSKLRCAIGGIYAWRLGPQCPAAYRPKSQAEFRALLQEAEFAFSQAFAFCPYNAEAVYRYANVLLQLNRLDDALLVARTCLKLDPFNPQGIALMSGLESLKWQQPAG